MPGLFQDKTLLLQCKAPRVEGSAKELEEGPHLAKHLLEGHQLLEELHQLYEEPAMLQEDTQLLEALELLEDLLLAEEVSQLLEDWP
jgi:hypothetical protein